MITHELYIDAEEGESHVLLELEGRERLAVLQAVRAPLHPQWSCKVYVRIEYTPLTDDAVHTTNPLRGGDADDHYPMWVDSDPKIQAGT